MGLYTWNLSLPFGSTTKGELNPWPLNHESDTLSLGCRDTPHKRTNWLIYWLIGVIRHFQHNNAILCLLKFEFSIRFGEWIHPRSLVHLKKDKLWVADLSELHQWTGLVKLLLDVSRSSNVAVGGGRLTGAAKRDVEPIAERHADLQHKQWLSEEQSLAPHPTRYQRYQLSKIKIPNDRTWDFLSPPHRYFQRTVYAAKCWIIKFNRHFIVVLTVPTK